MNFAKRFMNQIKMSYHARKEEKAKKELNGLSHNMFGRQVTVLQWENCVSALTGDPSVPCAAVAMNPLTNSMVIYTNESMMQLRLSRPELYVAAVAHEIGHYELGHVACQTQVLMNNFKRCFREGPEEFAADLAGARIMGEAMHKDNGGSLQNWLHFGGEAMVDLLSIYAAEKALRSRVLPRMAAIRRWQMQLVFDVEAIEGLPEAELTKAEDAPCAKMADEAVTHDSAKVATKAKKKTATKVKIDKASVPEAESAAFNAPRVRAPRNKKKVVNA